MEQAPIIVRGSAGVWLTAWMTRNESAAQIIEGIVTGERHLTEPCFTRPNAKFDQGNEPWLKIGTAEIVVTMTPPNNLAAEEIRALQRSLDAMRAQHQLAQQALLNRISKLQALTLQAA